MNENLLHIRLKFIRKDLLLLTQSQMAYLIGLSAQASYARYEYRERSPSMSILHAIDMHSGVDANWMADGIVDIDSCKTMINLRVNSLFGKKLYSQMIGCCYQVLNAIEDFLVSPSKALMVNAFQMQEKGAASE